jgi:transglutaminase-like putative cysteine protease
MTSEPLAPGAPAIILYRQVDRDDNIYRPSEVNYYRIKILTEEGRKRADVEVRFDKGKGWNLHGVQARTIHPDGSIVKFDGKVYEKTIVKGAGVKYLAKTFTLPDVQVGSIIEYRYVEYWDEYWLFNSRWIVSEDLFTKHARFSLKPYEGDLYQWRCTWQGLPAGVKPQQDAKGTDHLEVHDIPAFQEEDYMPPENELKARVDFIYSESVEADADKFWKKEGKKLNGTVDGFVNKRKAMEQAVAEVVSASDTPEAKLQKIYARVQKFRNLSYEKGRTEQEAKRENLKDVKNVESIWKQGYGDGADLTWLFLGLARAAGFDAWPVIVSSRGEYFFNPKRIDARQLNANVVLVKLNGQDLYFDPGSRFTPYGLLPWEETAVTGLRLDRDGGTWVQTSLPPSDASAVERKGELKLDETGTLEGKLKVTYTGLEASSRRQEERFEDTPARKKFLEDDLKGWVPAAIEIELKNEPAWDSSADALVAEFDLKVPGWVAGAGRRALMPVGLFSGAEKHVFEHTLRVYDIYFRFPSEEKDDITVELPPGWQVGTLPRGENIDAPLCGYRIEVENKNGTLHLTRRFAMHGIWQDKGNYGLLRDFYQTVRSGDELQIVLQPGSGAAAN